MLSDEGMEIATRGYISGTIDAFNHIYRMETDYVYFHNEKTMEYTSCQCEQLVECPLNED